MECWSSVPGYSYYEVSNEGRVRRSLKDGHRMLKPLIGSNGYRQVCLYAGGKGRRVLIHRLVAAAFLGPAPTGADEVNHKSGDKSDNRAANLEWATRRQNQRHAATLGLIARGQRNGAAVISDEAAAEIKGRLLAGWPAVSLAARFGVSKSQIGRIRTGENWGWMPPANGTFDAYAPGRCELDSAESGAASQTLFG